MGSPAEWNDLVREIRAAKDPWSCRALGRLFALAEEDGRKALRSFAGEMGDAAIDDLIHDLLVDQLIPIVQADEPRGYFRRALVRRAISRKRKGSSRVEAASEQEPPPSGPLDVVEQTHAARLDRAAAWARLSPREQEVLSALGEGEDRDALAERWGTTRNNIDQIISRARRRLAEVGS